MTFEQQEYLEREYSEFEKRCLSDQRFWRAPVFALTGTTLFGLFEQFSSSFPDHPSEYNTLFYLNQTERGDYSILLVCTHFEHTSLTDVRALMDLLERAARSIVRDGSSELIALELLDLPREELRIRFYDPLNDIVSLLQQHATRRPQ